MNNLMNFFSLFEKGKEAKNSAGIKKQQIGVNLVIGAAATFTAFYPDSPITPKNISDVVAAGPAIWAIYNAICTVVTTTKIGV